MWRAWISRECRRTSSRQSSRPDSHRRGAYQRPAAFHAVDLGHVPALVEAWNPAERGGEAVRRAVRKLQPHRKAGHLGAPPLPASCPCTTITSRPRILDAAWLCRHAVHPLYPFGYGLSYTDFAYSNLRVEPAEIHLGGEARVTLDVRNTGSRAGVETVQLYIHEQYAQFPHRSSNCGGLSACPFSPVRLSP